MVEYSLPRKIMHARIQKSVAVIVAHPDDETLWAGGTILSHPSWKVFIVCLSRGIDTERAPRFIKALQDLKAGGIMGDMDDGPEQIPLPEKETERAIMDLLPLRHYDLVITHNLTGEYTRHARHEEISKAVIKLWHSGKISATELWTFAYEDGNKEYLSRAVENASQCHLLTKRIWLKKYRIITETYGFGENAWEARTTPRSEAFWVFTRSYEAVKWLKKNTVS